MATVVIALVLVAAAFASALGQGLTGTWSAASVGPTYLATFNLSTAGETEPFSFDGGTVRVNVRVYGGDSGTCYFGAAVTEPGVTSNVHEVIPMTDVPAGVTRDLASGDVHLQRGTWVLRFASDYCEGIAGSVVEP